MRKTNPRQARSAARRSVALDQDLTIYHAQEHRRVLLEAVAETQAIEVDLSRVAEIDTAGLQVLLLTKRECMAAGKEMRILAPSAAVQEVLAFLNLAEFLGDPQPLPARERA